MSILNFLPPIRSRVAGNAADAELRRRISARSLGRPGPPAIALARQLYEASADITIDPLETDIRACPGGLAVRAWVRVPQAAIPAAMAEALASSTHKLQAVSRRSRQVFYLSTAYGLGFDDIARFLRMRPRHVRRAILDAIAALDAR